VAPQTTDAAPPPPSVEPPASAGDLAKLRESYERKDYEEAIRLADVVLKEDPGSSEAREYRIKAKAELDSASAEARLKAGVASYEAGDYAACVRAMEQVLQLDEGNAAARDYLYKADTSLSKRDILAMIEARRRAEESEDLAGVLKGLGPEALTTQERAYFEMIFTIYDGIKSQIPGSSISIAFSDQTHATAGFHHAIQGVSKKDGRQKPILFSQERWVLEKRGGAWKIVRIQERS